MSIMSITVRHNGWNFIKLEVNLVKLSLQDEHVLECQKAVPFLYKGSNKRAASEKVIKNGLFWP